MEKSLSERIKEREMHRNQSRGSKNKVMFLALRKDITEALNDGWAMKSIWETLHEEKKIDFSYKTFRLYVHRLILGASQSTAQNENISKPVDGASQDKKTTQKSFYVEKPAFRYNPTPNIEDLI